jgi:glycosyltransferase involved in cell wall biosynthesis
MNIVFLLRFIDSGGISRVVYDSSTYLTEKNFKVYIFYGKYLGDDNSFKNLLTNQPNLELIQLKGFSLDWRSLFHLPFSTLKFLYCLFKFKIDIIHLHWMSLSFFCLLSKYLLRIPFVTTIHLINHSRFRFYRFYSSCNIAISTEIYEWLINSEKIDSEYVYKIYNSVSKEYFPFINFNKRKINKLNNGLSNKIVLLCLSRFEQVKRHDILIKAISKLKAFDFILLLAGEGKVLPYIKSMVTEFGLNDHVKFMGHVDPREILSFSDIIILTSDREGFPMAIIEAMFSGVVPIRTDSEGAHDQIINRKNGFIIERGNINELKNILMFIFRNPTILKEFSHSAYEFSSNNFDFNSNQSKIVELYNFYFKTKL